MNRTQVLTPRDLKKSTDSPNLNPSGSTSISPQHNLPSQIQQLYLQPRNPPPTTNGPLTKSNQSQQFSGHAAIPEAAHLHPDEQHWSQTLLLFHHSNTNRQLKSLCKTRLRGGCVSSSLLPLIIASD